MISAGLSGGYPLWTAARPGILTKNSENRTLAALI